MARGAEVTHFRNASAIDAELDKTKGQILIKAVGNQFPNGQVLTTLNLDATSDDAAYVH